MAHVTVCTDPSSLMIPCCAVELKGKKKEGRGGGVFCVLSSCNGIWFVDIHSTGLLVIGRQSIMSPSSMKPCRSIMNNNIVNDEIMEPLIEGYLIDSSEKIGGGRRIYNECNRLPYFGSSP